MGADGAATLVSAGGVPTITQPTTKLHILQGTIIMGVSGQVGLAQLYCDQVGKLWEGNKLGQGTSLPDVQRLLHKAIGQDAQPAVAGAAASVALLGNAIAAQLAITQSLVAVPVGGFKGRPELIQCNHFGMAEAANDDLPYVAIGSGQGLADPFLVFLRRIFWQNALPKIADGVFATLWTLVHSTSVAPGGVAEPFQIAVLGGRANKMSAKELSLEEIKEHRQHISEAEDHLKSFGENPQGIPASSPKVPTPPS